MLITPKKLDDLESFESLVPGYIEDNYSCARASSVKFLGVYGTQAVYNSIVDWHDEDGTVQPALIYFDILDTLEEVQIVNPTILDPDF